jgi:hypothetical protein
VHRKHTSTTEIQDTPYVYSITLKHPQTACSQCRQKLLFVASNCSHEIDGSCFKSEYKIIYFKTHEYAYYLIIVKLYHPSLNHLSSKYQINTEWPLSLHHIISIPKTQGICSIDAGLH